jgi:transcriptional regulator with XRE-family HTH domain
VDNRREKAWIDLKKLRTDHGWRQTETAEKLGVSREYVSAIENGRRGISMTVMDAIIRVFGVPYEDFFRA